MTLTFDEAGDLLDAMAEEFPPAFFEELSGGINLLPELKRDPDYPDKLYLRGEYCNDELGKRINIFYGTFVQFSKEENWTEEDWTDELRTTLAHELTHHVEGRAGAYGLEVKDAAFMEQFRKDIGEK